MADLLIPYALKEGRIVHVDSVARGRACDCICPACDGLLVARKGNIRTHHFAHDRDTVCDGESALHVTAKLLLFQRIQDALQEQAEIPMLWDCLICSVEHPHKGNLLKRTTFATMEQTIPSANIRPDILLTDADGAPTALLEIVHTHAPEQKVITYAEHNELPLLEFNVESSDDLIYIMANELRPRTARMAGCPCQICQHCKERICNPDKHRHCTHCNQLYDPGYGPNDGHYFCEQCQQCVDAPSDFSVFHWHCRDCEAACYGRSRYVRCFCCFNEGKFGVKCTARNRPDHRHCRDCGRVFNHRGIYEVCYNCNQIALSQAMREWDQIQQEQKEAQREQEKIRLEREREYELKNEQRKQEWAALQRDLDKSIARRQSRTDL